MFGFRRETVPFGNLTNFDTVFRVAVPFDQVVQVLMKLIAIDVGQRLMNGVEADRLLREINDGLKQGRKISITHKSDSLERLFLRRFFPAAGRSRGGVS